MFFTGNIVDMNKEKNKELIILFCERFRPEAQRRLIGIMITDLQRVMQLSRFYPSLWEMQSNRWALKKHDYSRALSLLSLFICLSLFLLLDREQKWLVTVSLREAPDVVMLATPIVSQWYTYTQTDRKITRCQDRPAFEMIFGFGPGETRIAVSYNTVVNARLNSTVMNVSGRILRIYFRSASWRTLCTHNQSIC